MGTDGPCDGPTRRRGNDPLADVTDEHLSGRRNHDTALWALVVFAQFLESATGVRKERGAMACPVN